MVIFNFTKSEQMKQFFKSILAIIPFCIIFYLVMLFAWGKIVPDRLKLNLITDRTYLSLRIEEIPKFKNVDILFLGASSAYRSFDTRLYEKIGYKSFNLGSSSQTPIQTKILLDRYVEILNPDMIIYEVSPRIFNIDGVEAAVNLIINDKVDINSVKMTFELKNVKTINTLIYSLINNVFIENKDIKRQKDDNYISGGFVEKDLAFNEEHDIHHNEKYILNNQQIEAFNKTLQIIKEKNIKLIFVQSPIVKSEYELYPNKEFDEKMQEYGEYYNFNEILELNDTIDFFDEFHMNQNGVIIFNEKLISILGLKNE